MNLLPTNSLGGRFDCRYFAISCRLSAGSPPCVCYCATTYTLNWRRACFQTRTTRASNHRHSSCINDLEAALTGVFPQVRCYFSPVLSPVSPRCCGHFFVAQPQPPTNFRCYFLPFSCWFPVLPPLSAVFAAIFPGFPPVLRPACATARQRIPSTGGVPAFKPGPHVHPITDTQAVSTTWRLF